MKKINRVLLSSAQLPPPSGCLSQVPRLCPSLPGKGSSVGPSPGRPRPWHRRGWEEKVAAVAQSARVSATRDGLPVGQSQLRAPDQALGERTNKCSRARIPALGVTTGGDSGRPRSHPHPPPWLVAALAAPSPAPPAAGPLAQTRTKLLRPGLAIPDSEASLPAPFPGSFPSRSLDEERAALLPTSLPLFPAFLGRGSPRSGAVPESRQHRARLSVSPSPGYNFPAKLPPG